MLGYAVHNLFKGTKNDDEKTENRRLECIKCLVESGVDINMQDPIGTSFLHYSMANNCDKITNYLISAGINQFIVTQHGLTATDYAKIYRDESSF